MTDFALRAPWYVRERARSGVGDPAMHRPAIQMYDHPEFVRRLTTDPRDSLAFDDKFDDVWTYPVPVLPSGIGRGRLATWDYVTTGLRKLYQPNHNRFYAVVVEVFCDQPGLPRAGSHDDFKVEFVMRRQYTAVSGPRGPKRHVVRDLVKQLAADQRLAFDDSAGGLTDARDLWWAEEAHRRFLEEHQEDIEQLDIDVREQGWFTRPDKTKGRWQQVSQPDEGLVEETFPMWRLPAREDDCAAARTRSTWFGLIPTYSADHYLVRNRPRPKYDSQALYEIRCVVTKKPIRGHEHCPPVTWSSTATEPFRIADPMDPQGTEKRAIAITLPDLRRLAARAGRPMGPGGLVIATPPKSQLVFDPFDISKQGAIGKGGGICTFAFELFFFVAFFVFIMFLPIVVFLFQLWFLLSLRFCIPSSAGLKIAAEFFAKNNKLMAEFRTDSQVQHDLDDVGLTPDQAVDQIFGTDSTAPGAPQGAWADKIAATPAIAGDSDLTHAIVKGTDPGDAAREKPPELEPVPADPLCPAPAATPLP